MLPNCFIVGAPKAGTTSLYHYLKEHPEVYMSSVKEPNFFSFDEIAAQNLYYKERGIETLEEYEKLFKDVKDEKVIGEASVSYLFYQNVPHKIKRLIPEAKIIIILRNPVERGFSHYLMDLRLGYVNLPFEDIAYKRGNHKNLHLYYQQYLELGLYYKQVKRYLETFGKENGKIFIYDDLKRDAEKIMKSLYKFLHIDETFRPNVEKKHNIFEMPKNRFVKTFYTSKEIRTMIKAAFPKFFVSKLKDMTFSKENKPELKEDTKEYLRTLYKEDIKGLESLLRIQLEGWFN